jgi:rubrerythrin
MSENFMPLLSTARGIVTILKGKEVVDMPTWKCTQCGATSEGRCRPKVCPSCGAGKEQIAKAE